MKNLGELVNGDYPRVGALIWRRKLTDITLLLMTGLRLYFVELEAWGSVYVVPICDDHSQLSSM